VLGATYSLAFDIVFGIFVVAMVVLTVLTVRFVLRRDRRGR
jgi:membrane protein implicated in regulation of membrane protease activity